MLRQFTRRAALAIAGALAAVRPALGLTRTPEQTAGPFYPPPSDRFDDTDTDLVKVEGAVREAGGEVLHLSGRVLDGDGAPVAGSIVEIWQCDANGRYLHHRDRGGPARDGGFQGYGHMTTGADGRFAFRTIRPVPYPGRTPHIHARVTPADGPVLTTQLYVAGEVLNERDFIYASLSEDGKEALTMRLGQRADGDLGAEIDLVV